MRTLIRVTAVLAALTVGVAFSFGRKAGSDNARPAAPAGADAGKEKPGRDWTVFRGDALQDGVTAAALPDELEVLWTFTGKEAFEATVAISRGVVYAGCYDENLYALRLSDGKLLWQEKIGPVKAAPSVYRGAVYVGTEDGTLFCLDAESGKKRWSFETGGEITGGVNFAGDRVLFGSYDGFLYCLTTDGKVTWKVKTEGPVNGAPAVAGTRTFVAGCDSHVHVIDLVKGTKLRAIDLEGQAAATAAVRGDLLYVGTMTNEVKAIDWAAGNVAWTYQPKGRADAFYSSAAVTDRLVVVGSRDKKVHALDRKTGQLVWTAATGRKVDSSPVVAGSRVYVGSMDGSLYVLDLGAGTRRQKLELGRGISASPAVADGRLVIGTTDGVLYCLGKKK
jgi:outer membrane protein assembly factor BamB